MSERICVVGLGKLGSPIAVSFALAGINVMGYDLDAKKVEAINYGRAPVQEPGLFDALLKARNRIKATTDPAIAVEGTDICIFVAPTPSLPDGSFDNQYLLSGIEKIAPVVGNRPYIFVIASTVTPGSCENILLPAIRRHSSTVQLVYKPELIALGTVMLDLAHPDIGLIGADDPEAGKQVFRLYTKLQLCDFVRMPVIDAELAKISLNCAVTMKISFANQVSMVARQLGANPHVVLDFVGSDSRIGKKALRAGMPFGGPCFPRDNRMFQHVAKKVSIDPHLAAATDRINSDLLQDILNEVSGTGDIGILGLAYKAGTTVTEESAGLALQKTLLAEGRTVWAHDPLISPCGLKDVCDCCTIIITTDCAEYRELRFRPDQFVIDPMGVVKTQKKLSAVG